VLECRRNIIEDMGGELAGLKAGSPDHALEGLQRCRLDVPVDEVESR